MSGIRSLLRGQDRSQPLHKTGEQVLRFSLDNLSRPIDQEQDSSTMLLLYSTFFLVTNRQSSPLVMSHDHSDVRIIPSVLCASTVDARGLARRNLKPSERSLLVPSQLQLTKRAGEVRLFSLPLTSFPPRRDPLLNIFLISPSFVQPCDGTIPCTDSTDECLLPPPPGILGICVNLQIDVSTSQRSFRISDLTPFFRLQTAADWGMSVHPELALWVSVRRLLVV